MNRTNIRIGILIYFLIGTSVFAQATVEVTEIPMVAPARVGMSSERLAEVDRTIQGYVDEGKMVGGIVMIARRGEICFFEDYGMADRENGRAMRKDSILRFYSMTKAITTAAVLMLHDEGKLSPDDLVAKYIPELSELSIVTEEDEKTANALKDAAVKPFYEKILMGRMCTCQISLKMKIREQKIDVAN